MQNKSIKLEIVSRSYFNNGLIMEEYVSENIVRLWEALEKEIEVETILRTGNKVDSYEGIKANSVNKMLRESIRDYTDFKLETRVWKGIFLHKGKEGFDFSHYDEELNKEKFWNDYFGEYSNQKKNEDGRKLIKELGFTKSTWAEYKNKKELIVEGNRVTTKTKMTIVGEIQFGNWGLLYKDMFRLLAADVYPGVDLYIYVTATGKLLSELSDNVVTFEAAKKLINENLSLIRTPVIIIGLDYASENMVNINEL